MSICARFLQSVFSCSCMCDSMLILLSVDLCALVGVVGCCRRWASRCLRVILQRRINNGPRASFAVVHLTNVLFCKMDSSGLCHSSNVVCQAITLNMLVHSTPFYRVAFVAHFHALKRIWMFGTSHSIYFITLMRWISKV